MSQQYLIVKARNTVTGATQKQQDLTGVRFTVGQRSLAEDQAERFADSLSGRTGETWVGFVEQYTPSVRRS